jgi:hypothetical protein
MDISIKLSPPHSIWYGYPLFLEIKFAWRLRLFITADFDERVDLYCMGGVVVY